MSGYERLLLQRGSRVSEEGRRAQAALYGEPLGEIFSRCSAALGFNQSRMAGLLGISAPMLSQLINARRVKIGNPTAVHRLQVMHEAVADLARGETTVEQAIGRIEATGSGREFFTSTTRRSKRDDLALDIQELFRRVASASEYLAAAEAVSVSSPEIAELLRTYGGGRADEANAHVSRYPRP